MNKKGKYVDCAFLLIIALLIILTIYRHLTADFILSINNYVGFLLYLLFTGAWFYKKPFGKYLVLVLLLLYTLNIINFTVERFTASFGTDINEIQYSPLSINPIALILLIIYICLNGSIIKGLYTDNEEESSVKLAKKIDFYYNKFSECTEQELIDILKNYNNYPEEAKIALDKLKSNI